jgi:diguanylate cyclase (GGDEF)-like protein/putative nucleotidyltransferase with HDIG domain
MNVYALFPLVATVVYIPLLLTTAGSRPWQKRHTLFILFLVSAMLWSLSDFFFRSNIFPQYAVLMGKIVVSIFVWTATQFYFFISSFFPPNKGRWLVAAFILMIAQITLLMLGVGTEGVKLGTEEIYPQYNYLIFVITLPMMFYAGRAAIVFIQRMKNLNNPVLYSQIFSMLLSLVTMTIFIFAAILPFGREFPVSHFGNIINAFILSYAVIRHQLVDIKIVLRKSTAWLSLAILGTFSFWLLLMVLHKIFNFELDLFASAVATIIAVFVAVFIFKVRNHLFNLMNRAFQGSSYNDQQRLYEFTNRIHNVFSLKEQGGELLSLLIKAINIKQAALLFPESESEEFKVQFFEPKEEDTNLSSLRLRAGNPIVKYLEKEQKLLPKENLAILPAFLSLWPQEREEINAKNIAMFVPMISRDRLIAILVLGRKESGRYSLEDLNIIQSVTSHVAVSMEKEYLREQLREREEELSVINSSSVILSSSLDIQQIFPSFVEELKKVIDVDWASIVLIEDNSLLCMALSAPEKSAYQIGDKVPMEGTGTGWVVTQKKPYIEPDLEKELTFATSEYFYTEGLRTIAYIPLIAKGKVIGSFILGSQNPNAYSQRHIKLLVQTASQIAMPLENTQLYAKAEKKARVDELTGLLNRRSLDEMIDSEISRHSRYGGEFSLAILDLDSFKAYNDTYGHLAGDKLLQEIGFTIKAAIRTSDYAFRYGGDEFAILLPQTSIDAAFQVAERVRRNIADTMKDDKVPVTASIGIASWPNDGITHTDIIASADVTLYRSKRNGGNQTLCVSSPIGMLTQIGGEMESENDLDVKFSKFVHAFSEMVDSRSYYTVNHSKRVTDYAVALAKALKLEKEEIYKLETCALLHDIGKMGISLEILNKPGKLTEEEWQIVKTHPKRGAEIVRNIPHLKSCIEVILHHHEWYDGNGYPDKLKGEKIPYEARVLAITDAFASMTSERSYSETMTHENALEEIKKCAGTQFDPSLVEQFVAIMKKQMEETTDRVRR